MTNYYIFPFELEIIIIAMATLCTIVTAAAILRHLKHKKDRLKEGVKIFQMYILIPSIVANNLYKDLLDGF